MSNVCFAFGPNNSYLCNGPSKWTRNNLPPPVEHLFTKQPPIKNIYDLVLGPSGSYYVGYLDHDNKVLCKDYGLPPTLTKWLGVNAKGYVDHDIRTTSITLGPNGSYVARDKNKMQWHGVPASLAARLNKYGAAGTRLVTLGKDDSFVVIGADGSGLRNLGPKNFEALDKHLGSLPNLSSIHYISLSSYDALDLNGALDGPANMRVSKNGSFGGTCPSGHEARFEIVLGDITNFQQNSGSSSARGSKTSSTMGALKLLGGVLNVANAVLGGNNGGGGGNSSGGNGGGGFDTSGFTAGLQQQTWSSTSGAASDPIQ